MSLDCGRKPENPMGTHAATGRTCKLHSEEPPGLGCEPVALLLWGDGASHYTTVQPYSKYIYFLNLTYPHLRTTDLRIICLKSYILADTSIHVFQLHPYFHFYCICIIHFGGEKKAFKTISISVSKPFCVCFHDTRYNTREHSHLPTNHTGGTGSEGEEKHPRTEALARKRSAFEHTAKRSLHFALSLMVSVRIFSWLLAGMRCRKKRWPVNMWPMCGVTKSCILLTNRRARRGETKLHQTPLLCIVWTFNSIQISLFYIAQYHKLQICLRGL